jgi:uncharacterized protein YndB with AHSA1/START domain
VSSATTVHRAGTALTFERTFRASRARVFDAFTVPELLMRWWGPRDWPMVSCSLDLVPGGTWHYCLRAADGRQHWARATYREIARPARVSYAENSSNERGEVTDDVAPTLTVVTFTERDGSTTLRSHVTFPAEQHLEAALRRGMREGFTQALGFLEELLAREDDLLLRSEGQQQ